MPVFANEAESAAIKEKEKRLATINYGIDSQLIELLTTLKSEKSVEFKNELVQVFDRTTANKLKIAIFDFFSFFELSLLEDRAFKIIANRDNLDDKLVNAAIEYHASIKSILALNEYKDILENEEKKYYQPLIKALAASTSSKNSESFSELLVNLYEKDGTDIAVKESIIKVIGSMKANTAYDLLTKILMSEESGKAAKMYACTSLAELGDKRAVPVLIQVAQGSDPNIRAKSIEALGFFNTSEALSAVREGLRDAHVLVRSAAASSSGKNKDEDALPYLEYKALWDPEKSVRENSIKALGQIGNNGAFEFLTDFIEDNKQSLQYRAIAMASLISNGREADIQKALIVYKTSATEKDKSNYNSFSRQIIAIDNLAALPFVEFMLSDKDFSTRLGAIAWIERNDAKSMLQVLKDLSSADENEAVRTRAARAVLKLES